MWRATYYDGFAFTWLFWSVHTLIFIYSVKNINTEGQRYCGGNKMVYNSRKKYHKKVPLSRKRTDLRDRRNASETKSYTLYFGGSGTTESTGAVGFPIVDNHSNDVSESSLRVESRLLLPLELPKRIL